MLCQTLSGPLPQSGSPASARRGCCRPTGGGSFQRENGPQRQARVALTRALDLNSRTARGTLNPTCCPLVCFSHIRVHCILLKCQTSIALRARAARLAQCSVPPRRVLPDVAAHCGSSGSRSAAAGHNVWQGACSASHKVMHLCRRRLDNIASKMLVMRA